MTEQQMRRPGLTGRHRQVIAAMERGLTFPEIAAELGISSRTVKAHADTIRRRLGVKRAREIPHAYRVLTTGPDANRPDASKGGS